MIAKLKIGELNIRCVVRHRFEKKREEDYVRWNSWRDWRLGLWFKRSRAVGKKDFNKPAEWSANLVSIYTVGLDLLIAKVWIDIDRGVKHF